MTTPARLAPQVCERHTARDTPPAPAPARRRDRRRRPHWTKVASLASRSEAPPRGLKIRMQLRCWRRSLPDRKSTRLNSSHLVISYAVFCLKKKYVLRDDDQLRRTQRACRPVAHATVPTRTTLPSTSRSRPPTLSGCCSWAASFFFLMIRRPPRSTLFPTRRSSD